MKPHQLTLPAAAMPTARRCQHQTSPIPCAQPSCPAGVQGKKLRLVVVRNDGQKVVTWWRRRLKIADAGIEYEWTPL